MLKMSFDFPVPLSSLPPGGVGRVVAVHGGRGENEQEIDETMDDLLRTGCEILTIGQYLKPSPEHMDVVEYVSPERFEKYRESALEKGFRMVESAPLVRSSFHAEKHITGG